MKEQIFAIRKITPDSLAWLPLQVPIDCNYVEIINQGTADVLMRTDDGNAESEMVLQAGAAYELPGPGSTKVRSGDAWVRFPAGAVVAFFKSSSGSGLLVGTFAS